MPDKDKDKEVSYNISEHIGVVAKYTNGWIKELNMVEWNGNDAKYDLRDWDPAHEHMSRGITLKQDEAAKVLELLSQRDLTSSNKN